MSSQGFGGMIPWGWIQPMKKAIAMNTKVAIDSAMRRVRNLAVRLDSPRSPTRLNIAAPRLSTIRPSSARMIIIANADLNGVFVPGTSVPDRGLLST